jgi:4-hydroxy-2-oxoheptanedioate aldolase
MENRMRMNKSRVLEKLRSGGVATSIKINLADSRACEIAAMAGFDCLWSDMEHVANDWSVIEKQVLTAKAYGTDLLVRVARGGYSDYTRPLELDAAGIMVPHIMSLDDAKDVVRKTRFYPLGRRPLDGGNADGAYCNIDLLDYMEDANKNRFVIVQIEDPEPMDDIEEIAALEGIDMLFFGPGDFSQGIGAPGQWDNPELLSAQKKVAQVCAKAGKYAGTVGSVNNFAELADMGYGLINLGADVVGLGKYFNEIISAVNEKENSRASSIYGGK